MAFAPTHRKSQARIGLQLLSIAFLLSQTLLPVLHWRMHELEAAGERKLCAESAAHGFEGHFHPASKPFDDCQLCQVFSQLRASLAGLPALSLAIPLLVFLAAFLRPSFNPPA